VIEVVYVCRTCGKKRVASYKGAKVPEKCRKCGGLLVKKVVVK